MKTFRFTLLTIATLLCSISASAHDFEVDGIYYNITSSEDLTVKVTFRGYSFDRYSNEYIGEVFIPAHVVFKGMIYSVTSIGDYAFRECSGLTNITIPNSVTHIGNSAFENCSNLTDIKLPESLINIGSDICIGTGWLSNQPEGLLYLNNVLLGYKGEEPVGTLTVKEGTTLIGDHAFQNCFKLLSVNIPNTVKYIDDYAFSGCARLTSITIPNSVTSIGYSAFSSCTGLTSITIPNSVESIASSTFYLCSSLVSIVIPNSVESIASSTFRGCSSLTNIVIPNSVKTIKEYAFGGCSNLSNITIPNSVTEIEDHAFEKSGITDIVIPNSVTIIDYNAFSLCDKLESITLPNSIKKITSHLFYRCSKLKSITIPNSVTSIEQSAFSGCSLLTNITIGNSVDKIGSEAFEKCAKVKEIISYAIWPPICGNDALTGINKTQCTLKVVEGCKAVYQAEVPWKEFSTIEDVVSGIDNTIFDIENINAPIYNLQGIEMEDKENLPAGIYIQGGKKIVVK